MEWDDIDDATLSTYPDGHPIYYDPDGNPILFSEWAEQRQQNRHVGSDEVDGVWVSTVYLGMDHGFFYGQAGYKPIIYETMVFGGEHDQYQERYSTYEQARKGHERAIRMAFGYTYEPTWPT